LELGSKIEFYPGIPDIFIKLKEVLDDTKYEELNLENYILSTGLRKMILGSKINKHVEYVWGSEFVSDIAPSGYNTEDDDRLDKALDRISPDKLIEESLNKEIVDIGYVLDNTTKTRAIFEINKGSNKESTIDVNASIHEKDRRVPFNNMIYIADGPSDIPVFSIIKRFHGKAYAVYKPGDEKEFNQVNSLLNNQRIDCFGEADYKENTQTYLWLINSVKEIADRIIHERKDSLSEKVGDPPAHIA